MQKTLTELLTDITTLFGNGKDLRGDDEKAFNQNQAQSVPHSFFDGVPGSAQNVAAGYLIGKSRIIDFNTQIEYLYVSGTTTAVWAPMSGNWTPTFTGFTTASDIVSSFMDLGSRVAFNLQFDANIAEPLNGQITVPDFLPMATGANIVCQGVWVNRYNSDAGVINAYVDSDGSGKIQLNIISIENPTDCEFSIVGSYKKA